MKDKNLLKKEFFYVTGKAVRSNSKTRAGWNLTRVPFYTLSVSSHKSF